MRRYEVLVRRRGPEWRLCFAGNSIEAGDEVESGAFRAYEMMRLDARSPRGSVSEVELRADRSLLARCERTGAKR